VLWAVHNRATAVPVLRAEPSVAVDPRLPAAFYLACGYWPAGPRAVRADRLERLAAAARQAQRRRAPLATPAIASLIDGAPTDLEPVLVALGFSRPTDARAAAGGRRRP
jgi:ATP-dependent RNA helicase SUPV3L1/SUV3